MGIFYVLAAIVIIGGLLWVFVGIDKDATEPDDDEDKV